MKRKGPIRVLGVDPGFGRLGWAVLDGPAHTPHLVASGCVETASRDALTLRMVKIFSELKDVIRTFRPMLVSVEKLFFQKNVSTAIGVGQARGLVLLACGESALPVLELTPTDIKLSTTGFGRADKSQVARMVKTLLHLTHLPKQDDEVDAIAIGLCALSIRYGTTT